MENPPIGRAMESTMCDIASVISSKIASTVCLGIHPSILQPAAFPKVSCWYPGRQQQCQGQENEKVHVAHSKSTLAQRTQLDTVLIVF